MGMDFIEFVMDVEEAFDVRVPDHVAGTLTTPRELIDGVHRLLPPGDAGCFTQRAFYHVRRELAGRVAAGRDRLRPRTELATLSPGPTGGGVWAGVGIALGASRRPSLHASASLARLLDGRPRTLGDVARYVVTFAPRAVKRPGEGWSRAEVAAVIDGHIRHHFAVTDYRPDDNFFRDLGIN